MKTTFVMLTVCAALGLVSSMNTDHQSLNRPIIHALGPRLRRSPNKPQDLTNKPSQVDGTASLPRVYLQRQDYQPAQYQDAGNQPAPLKHNLRKGEFVCGGKVCKLEPRTPALNTDGLIMQYPIML